MPTRLTRRLLCPPPRCTTCAGSTNCSNPCCMCSNPTDAHVVNFIFRGGFHNTDDLCHPPPHVDPSWVEARWAELNPKFDLQTVLVEDLQKKNDALWSSVLESSQEGTGGGPMLVRAIRSPLSPRTLGSSTPSWCACAGCVWGGARACVARSTIIP